MKRGVGFCENIECGEYYKGVFVMSQNEFFCPRCRVKGFIEWERYQYDNDFSVIREVRVEFDYAPIFRKYNSIAIARDDELGNHCNVLTVFSPLCKTEKRALKLAELYFAYVSLNGVSVNNLDSKENTIDLDSSRDNVIEQCQRIGEKWDEAAVMRKTGLPLETVHG